MIKLFLDDLRKPKDETWAHAKNYDEVIRFFEQCRIEGKIIDVASLDHDILGMAYNYCKECRSRLDVMHVDQETKQKLWHEIFIHGCLHNKTGRNVIEWIIDNGAHWPKLIIIHSHNDEAAVRMAALAMPHTDTIIQRY